MYNFDRFNNPTKAKFYLNRLRHKLKAQQYLNPCYQRNKNKEAELIAEEYTKSIKSIASPDY